MLTADRGDAGERLDLVLRRHLTDVPSATRTRVQRWIAAGQVLVNGTVVRRAAARAALGDILAVQLPAMTPRQPPAGEAIPLHILYEDDHLLAVNKPAGLVAHPTHRQVTGTLMNALLGYGRAWRTPQRPSLVSRLDKDTSGVVLVAKTALMHTALQSAMGSQETTKDYLALVYGRVPIVRGEIELRLRRDPLDRRRVIASPKLGTPSVTRFERVATAKAPEVGLSLLRCRLVTGRTHQIRVHLAARGWPIVGDPTYGERRWSEIRRPELRGALRRFPRQALHAWRVELTHPVTGEPLTVEAPMPRDFADVLTVAGLRTP